MVKTVAVNRAGCWLAQKRRKGKMGLVVKKKETAYERANERGGKGGEQITLLSTGAAFVRRRAQRKALEVNGKRKH